MLIKVLKYVHDISQVRTNQKSRHRLPPPINPEIWARRAADHKETIVILRVVKSHVEYLTAQSPSMRNDSYLAPFSAGS